MYFLESPSHDPAFNISLEEYLLRETDKEFFVLYVDAPSVIVGKHQNTLAEINYRFIIENEIPVIRRISGGGTVFHDLGNLNFCFIANSHEGHQIDFKKYTQPVIEILQNEFNIPAQLAGKNDIRVNDLKVSGNAEHVFKNRVLHHGTLLVNSDLQNLSQALKVVPGKYIDKAVKSIRSKVANLNSFNPDITLEDLKKSLKAKLFKEIQINEYVLTSTELEIIKNKVSEKFSAWEWNYGYSPSYALISEGIVLRVENGIILEATIGNNNKLAEEIIGKPHSYNELSGIQDFWKLF